MLKSIRLKNFKLHEDTSIQCAPITVFIGPNNSGKSSVFQAALALRQASWRNLKEFLPSREPAAHPAQRPTSILVDIGDFPDVVRQGQSRLEIHVAGVVHSRAPLSYDPIDVSFGVGVLNNALVTIRDICSPPSVLLIGLNRLGLRDQGYNLLYRSTSEV